jgi:hypothetical protein
VEGYKTATIKLEVLTQNLGRLFRIMEADAGAVLLRLYSSAVKPTIDSPRGLTKLPKAYNTLTFRTFKETSMGISLSSSLQAGLTDTGLRSRT